MSANTNFQLDLALFVGFLVAYNPALTGIPVHEWLGAAFLAALVAHVLFHWRWVVSVTRRWFSGPGRGARLNYVVDLVLFVALVAAVVSGLMISKHLLPSLGLAVPRNRAWRHIHSLGADLSLAALGVHIGLHWQWVTCLLRRLAGARRAARPGSATATA